jgi:Flp pilus assembly protein CpaB
MHRSRLVLMVVRVRRSTVVWTLVAAGVSVFAGQRVLQLERAAEAHAARYGELVNVVIVRSPVDAGDAVDASDVERTRLPAALLPRAALATRVVGRVARVALIPGEVVVEDRLASALVDAGTRAIAIRPPGSGAHPRLSIGDVVDVIDVATSEVIAADATVVDRGAEGAITVAVAADDAPAVASAAAAGNAALAVSAPAPPR